MNKFFISRQEIDNGKASIRGEDCIHISKSLRMKKGDKLELADGKGREYIGEILQINEDSVDVGIIEEYENNTELPVNITLFQGLPKASKMDLIVQKTVELGVNKIVPMITDRTIVSLKKNSNKKIERWKKISLEAAKQSKRGIMPEIMSVVKLGDVKAELLYCDLILIAYEGEKDKNLKQVLTHYDNVKAVSIFVGPEGGFARAEVEFLESLGGKSFSLGNRILRTETAGPAVMSMLTYRYEMRGE